MCRNDCTKCTAFCCDSSNFEWNSARGRRSNVMCYRRMKWHIQMLCSCLFLSIIVELWPQPTSRLDTLRKMWLVWFDYGVKWLNWVTWANKHHNVVIFMACKHMLSMSDFITMKTNKTQNSSTILIQPQSRLCAHNLKCLIIHLLNGCVHEKEGIKNKMQ